MTSSDSLADLEREIHSCRSCPRLVEWREEVAADPPKRHRGETYWARPVSGFGDPRARVAVVGLAPAAQGANRTGRVFTGDRSADWLYAAMHRAGYANQPESVSLDDGLRLSDAWVTCAVRCAPPANKPTPAERDACAPFLERELALRRQARVAVVLGQFVSKMADLPGTIDCLEHWYGPYTFGRVGYVLTTDGALEIAQNIAYPDFMPGQSLFNNRGLLAHELGHQWWGIRVSPYTHNEMWLKEGPAEYSGHLAEEWLYGRDAFVDVVKDNHLDILRTAHIVDDGFQVLSPIPDEHCYGTHTYYKGASVMHNLRGYLGDTLFRQGMTHAHTALYDTAMTAQDFRDALEAGTGYDLDAWVFQPGYSVFVVQDVSVTPNGGQWDVELTLRQRLREAWNWHEDVPLDLSLLSADRQRREFEVMATGEFTTVTVTTDIEPVMVVLNGHTRLNQARMDHEFLTWPGDNFNSTLPYVDFRLYDDVLTDTTLVRIEHIWAGPDQDLLGWGIDEISGTHYWRVDGLWPAGTEFRGRLIYDGAVSTDIDWDLLGGGNEADVLLLYRPDPSQPWEVYPDHTVNLGNPNDGNGLIDIDVLLPGDYCFGRGNAIVSVEDASGNGGGVLRVYPVPVADRLTVELGASADGVLVIDLLASDGRLVRRTHAASRGSGMQVLDVSELPEGGYLVRIARRGGEVLGTSRFVVAR